MLTDLEPTGPNNLAQNEAETRASLVSAVAYELALSLRANSPDYEGDCIIRFEHAGPSAGTFLDFTGKEILRFELNGTEVDSANWQSHRLQLDGALLREQNEVRIVYRNDFDHDGIGLHKFTDPEDGLEYIYTHFEPFDAHRLFPSFDQPDIKASYRLRVGAPAEWVVVANSPEVGRGEASDGQVIREYEQTPRFSTYLVALVAGPYHVFEESYESDAASVPLKILCRESLAKHMDPDEFFETTKQGLAFFGEFFDFPYPFAKYDQIFVPEFNMGAMENVGCITFSERMVFRDPPTELQRLGRAEVVLHEMAHMWFGDLVTMRWWNDLWLNESFATYMAYLAMTEATRFDEGSWPNFHGRMKAWAYEQDQLVTTHPISGSVPDTDATFLNFDGITYGKGASVLKQLVAAIGMNGFREGMRLYFKEYAWGNTTLDEFLGALERGSESELQEWSKMWLETAGVNTLAARLELDAGTIAGFAIEQTAPANHHTLRPHKLQLAIFDETDGVPTLREAIPVEVEGARTVVEELVGTPAPVAIFPNYEDHDYAKSALDERTLDYVRERLERFDDPFMRLLLWHSLWDMVRDQQFKSTDYLALVREKLPQESIQELVQTTIGRANLAQRAYTPDEMRLEQGRALYALAEPELRRADDPDLRILWARALVTAAQEPDTISSALRLADQGTGIDGFELDQEMRWSLVIKAMSHGLDRAEARLAAELERDPSDRGQRNAETARIATPDAAVKAAAWSAIRDDDDASLFDLRSKMHGFFTWHQRELTAPYAERFFDEVGDIFRLKTKDFATTYFASLYPHHLPTDTTVKRTESLIETLSDEDLMLKRSLREALDELRRARACRTFALG